MFNIYDPQGTRSIYEPGAIRRRVEGVAAIKPLRKVAARTHEPHAEDRARASYKHTRDLAAEREPAIVASQIMSSPLVTLHPSASLREAWELIREKRFRHVPVVSAEGKPVGILSDRDLLVEASNLEHLGLRRVDQVMATHVLTALPQTAIREIARTLLEERIGAMPIVSEHEELVGIVTRSDILRTVVNQAPLELWT